MATLIWIRPFGANFCNSARPPLHCGGVKTGGDFVHILTLIDIASGWTECVAV